MLGILFWNDLIQSDKPNQTKRKLFSLNVLCDSLTSGKHLLKNETLNRLYIKNFRHWEGINDITIESHQIVVKTTTEKSCLFTLYNKLISLCHLL